MADLGYQEGLQLAVVVTSPEVLAERMVIHSTVLMVVGVGFAGVMVVVVVPLHMVVVVAEGEFLTTEVMAEPPSTPEEVEVVGLIFIPGGLEGMQPLVAVAGVVVC